MDTEQQEPEELSPEEILMEIRRMLTADMAGQPLPAVPTNDVYDKIETTVADYILLTPEMRCDDVFDGSSDRESTHAKARQLLDKLSRLKTGEGVPATSSPASTEAVVTDWLNKNLPNMLNEIVSREIEKALKK